MKKIIVSDEIMQEAQNIVDGVYAPLTGFVGEDDFKSVCDRMKLVNGQVWAMPIILDIDDVMKREIENSNLVTTSEIIIYNGESEFVLTNITIYEINKNKYVKTIFGTDDIIHPGVKRFMGYGRYFVSGDVKTVEGKEFIMDDEAYTKPEDTKEIFRKNNWEYISAFQTRNPPHRSHEFLQKQSLEHANGIMIQPVIGMKKEGDIKDEYIIGTYEILIEKYFPKNSVFLNTFHTYMRYAGPREAVFHAQVRQNFGCTHMIIGRDHAGVGDYYEPQAAHDIFDGFTDGDIGVDILKYENAIFCDNCDDNVFISGCECDDNCKVSLSGTKMRGLLQDKKEISGKFMRPEIVEYLNKQDDIFCS
ncbi:MAG: sulfate adenylyltransferase [Candidatus Moraniibacteriota bacterium]|jgi:sulfate adenylyltransferase